MDYLELDITLDPIIPWREVLISQLAEIGFESFTEEKHGLKAYIPEKEFNENSLGALLSPARAMDVNIDYTTNVIKHQNWNAKWESDFSPVKVDNDLVIKAPFHNIEESFRFEILIEPQMSFGTGHHDTTYLLCKNMLQMDWTDKKVLDVGTGTGVLAILAQFLGASAIVGTEIDPGSFENAIDNVKKNNVESIELLPVDIDAVTTKDFDVIIANINKNVLKRHLPFYKEKIKKNGILMMSGFFASDIDELNEHAVANDFALVKQYTQNEWAVVKYKKN